MPKYRDLLLMMETPPSELSSARTKIRPADLFTVRRGLRSDELEEAVRFEAPNMFVNPDVLAEFQERNTSRVFAAIRKAAAPASDATADITLSETAGDAVIVPQHKVLGVLLAQVGQSRKLSADVSRLFCIAYPTDDKVLETLVSSELLSAWQQMLSSEGLAQLRVNVPLEDVKSERFYMDAGFMRHHADGQPTKRMVWPMDY